MYSQQENIQYPILGVKSNQELQQDIYKAIKDEATAAEFYTRLDKEAPTPLHHDFIMHARNDEVEHLQRFEKLYQRLYGDVPRFRLVPTQFTSYKEGLMTALKGELDAISFYRDVQLSVRDPVVRDTFYLPMVDELEHATRFSTLYNTV